MEAFDCETNSPCWHLRKCVKNSVENVHTDVRVSRVKFPEVINVVTSLYNIHTLSSKQVISDVHIDK